MVETIFYIIAVALCTAAISFTITVTSIFTWLRELLSSVHSKLEELIHCPYCLGHYIALVIMLTTDRKLINVTQYEIYNFLFTWFVIMCIVSLLHFVMLRAYKPVREFMMYRAMDKLQKKKKEKEDEEVF